MRAFTSREKLMLGVLATMVVGAAYYFLFFTPIQTRIADAQVRVTTAQDQQLIEQLKVVKLNQMKKEIEEMKAAGKENTRQLPEYNNLEMVMIELNGILLAADSYKIDFPDPDLTQRIVQRATNITFTAPNYGAAKEIIQRLSDCAYRCSVNSVNITAGGDSRPNSPNTVESVTTQTVSVAVTVTFYEKNVTEEKK